MLTLCTFSADGHVEKMMPVHFEPSESQRKGLNGTGWYLVEDDDLAQYKQGYIRDLKTGKPTMATSLAEKATPQVEAMNNSRVNVAEMLALLNARLTALETKEAHHD